MKCHRVIAGNKKPQKTIERVPNPIRLSCITEFDFEMGRTFLRANSVFGGAGEQMMLKLIV